MITEEFIDLAKKCYSYSIAHKNIQKLASNENICISFFITISSTISTLTSLGLSYENFYSNEKSKKLHKNITSGYSILTVILFTLKYFVNFESKAESHRYASIQFTRLFKDIYRDIYFDLTLSPIYLTNMLSKYKDLVKNSPNINFLYFNKIFDTIIDSNIEDLGDLNGITQIIPL